MKFNTVHLKETHETLKHIIAAVLDLELRLWHDGKILA